MEKNVELKNGASALNFIESLENSCAQLEKWCEKTLADYHGMGIEHELRTYVEWEACASCSPESKAWHYAMARFARRLASRYGIAL